jgi:hypothetical protein
MTIAEESAYALGLAERLKPVFAGKPDGVVGAALAELMATYLAAHVMPGDLKEEHVMREEILTMWCETVRALLAVRDKPDARMQ